MGKLIAYLGIIHFARSEQCIQRVIARNQKAGKVDQKSAGDVEENQKEIDSDKSEKSINLGYGSLLFKVVENRIFGELGAKISFPS